MRDFWTRNDALILLMAFSLILVFVTKGEACLSLKYQSAPPSPSTCPSR